MTQFGAYTARSRTAGSSFNPLALAGTIFVLDSTTAVHSDVSGVERISSWVDPVNGNTVSQAVDANKPEYLASWRNGYPAMQGASSRYLGRAAFTGGAVAGVVTWYLVGEWAADAAGFPFDSTNRQAIVTLNGNSAGYDGSITRANGPVRPGTPFVARMTYTLNRAQCHMEVRAHGYAPISTTGLTFANVTANGVYLGATYVGSNFFTGKVAFLSAVASDVPATHATYFDYLQERYNIVTQSFSLLFSYKSDDPGRVLSGASFVSIPVGGAIGGAMTVEGSAPQSGAWGSSPGVACTLTAVNQGMVSNHAADNFAPLGASSLPHAQRSTTMFIRYRDFLAGSNLFIMHTCTNNAQNGFILKRNTSGILELDTCASGSLVAFLGGAVVALNMICIKMQYIPGGSKYVELWNNGVLVASNTIGLHPSEAAAPLSIGGGPFNISSTGAYPEVRVYNGFASPAEQAAVEAEMLTSWPP